MSELVSEGGIVADGYTVGRVREMQMHHRINCDLKRVT